MRCYHSGVPLVITGLILNMGFRIQYLTEQPVNSVFLLGTPWPLIIVLLSISLYINKIKY
jgi:hypothetical protein